MYERDVEEGADVLPTGIVYWGLNCGTLHALGINAKKCQAEVGSSQQTMGCLT